MRQTWYVVRRCKLDDAGLPGPLPLMEMNHMILRMTPDEKALLEAFLRPTARYMEFGAGGTTCLAARLVSDWVISVDSSLEWLDAVAKSCSSEPNCKQPTLNHADIGPLGKWGRPADSTTMAKWPSYHRDVWATTNAASADLFMVDGRFRVACFLQILLRARAGAMIAIHDFPARPRYQVVRQFASCVATAGTLWVFCCKSDYDHSAVTKVLKEYEYDPG